MPSEPIHSIDLKRDSAAARFYLWLYEADPNKIDSCKLFWAFILAPLLILPVLLIKGVGKVIDRWEKNHPPKPRSYTPHKSREGKLSAFSNWASAIYAKYQTAFYIVGICIVILLTVAIVGGLGYLLITQTVKTLIVIAWVIGCVLVFGLGILTFAFFADGKGQGFVRLMRNLFRSFHQHTCAKVDLQ